VLSRTGGDEFTLLMPRTDGDAARELVQQILYAMKSCSRAGKPHPYEVSLSIGYSTKLSSEQSIDQVIKTAEEYLIHRKLLNQKSSHSASYPRSWPRSTPGARKRRNTDNG
jgi:GGDEF domain-containing protein